MKYFNIVIQNFVWIFLSSYLNMFIPEYSNTFKRVFILPPPHKADIYFVKV